MRRRFYAGCALLAALAGHPLHVASAQPQRPGTPPLIPIEDEALIARLSGNLFSHRPIRKGENIPMGLFGVDRSGHLYQKSENPASKIRYRVAGNRLCLLRPESCMMFMTSPDKKRLFVSNDDHPTRFLEVYLIAAGR